MSASRAFYSTFREGAMIPAPNHPWVSERLLRYPVYRSAYNNSVYRDVDAVATSMKQAYGLYRDTRGVINPVYRAVEMYASKTMGGALDWRKLETGAIRLTDADDTLTKAWLKLLQWSNFEVKKLLYARMTAMLGDGGLWVVDDVARGKVRIEVLDPSKIKDAEFDDVGNVKKATIEYIREWRGGARKEPQDVIYRMEVDKEKFATFKDDQPFGWHTDGSGNPVKEWDNEYGFVPLVIANFKDVGLNWGANCFHASLSKINEVNDVASILNDSMRNTIRPPWYLAGANGPEDIELDKERPRDSMDILYGPEGSRPYPMVMPIPIADAVQNINGMLKEVGRDLTVLNLQDIRERTGEMSGISVKNLYSDAIGQIIEFGGNLNSGLIRSVQMGITIAALRDYEDFRAYDLNSYARGDLDCSLKEPEVIEEGFTPKEEVEIIKSLPENEEAAHYIMVNKLQMSEEDAAKIIAGQQAVAAQKQAQQAAQFGQRQGDENPVTVRPNPRPQLPAGQGEDDDAAVQAEVQRIMQEVGIAA